MIIKKTVVRNWYETPNLSFRVPMGNETKLDVTFLGRAGQPYTADLAAQLQLTARSRNHSQFFAMPAIDVVNGKARAVIPRDTLTDPNGYRLRITGTWSGEPELLAMGTVIPIASAGEDAYPQDTIDTIDLSFQYGQDAELNVKLWDDISKSNPFDLTDVTVTSAVTNARGGTILAPFTVTIISANEVHLTLTAAQVDSLPASCWWSLNVTSAAGLTTLAEGAVTISGIAP